MLICQGPRRQSVIVHQPWQIGTGGDISLALSPAPSTPFWNWIMVFKSCTAIPHNSIQALLEAQLLSNQMFWRSALFWLCCFLHHYPPHPLIHTCSSIPGIASLKCIQYLRWMIIAPPIFFVFCFALQSIFRIPLTSSAAPLPSVSNLCAFMHQHLTDTSLRCACPISIQTCF